MFANRYQINLTTLLTGTTATTINIPITMDYAQVSQDELIERVFVENEVEKAINPIVDYEKARFLPLDLSGKHIDEITYILNLSGATHYSDIGFTDDDIKFDRNNFKNTFLNLEFYDTDNPLDQRLITAVTLYSHLTDNDLLPIGTTSGIPGQPKPATQIPLTFVVSNPILNPLGFSEGYYLYDYKDETLIGANKPLYMRASFNNAKTGKKLNLMVESTPDTIDNLVHKLYTKFILVRNSTGYYYEIDNTYHGNGSIGNNNVTYGTNSNVSVNLFQIIAL